MGGEGKGHRPSGAEAADLITAPPSGSRSRRILLVAAACNDSMYLARIQMGSRGSTHASPRLLRLDDASSRVGAGAFSAFVPKIRFMIVSGAVPKEHVRGPEVRGKSRESRAYVSWCLPVACSTVRRALLVPFAISWLMGSTLHAGGNSESEIMHQY